MFTTAEQGEAGAFESGLEQTVRGHVRSLTGAEHGEIPERYHRQAEVGGVERAQVLGCQLRYAVRAEGSREVGFGDGVSDGVAVDGRRRCVDHAADVVLDRRVEQSLRRVNVAPEVVGELIPPR